MSRKLALFGVVCLLGVILVSCSSCSKKEPGRYYNNRENFSMRFPVNWEVREGVMGTAVAALSPQEGSSDAFRENVNVLFETLPTRMSLEEYWNASLQVFSKTNFKIINQGDTKIGGENAKFSTYTCNMIGTDQKNKCYVLVRGDKGCVITCSAPASDFSRYETKFEEIVQSFRFE